MIVSCGFLENEWCKRRSEEEEMQGEVLTHKEEKAFQKSYMKVVVKKLPRAGMMPARTW